MIIDHKKSNKNPIKRIKSTINSIIDIENIKLLSTFNSKGYFDANQPFNQNNVNIKQKVFQKYRNFNDQQQIIMIDKFTNTNKSSFVQRGCLLPIIQKNQRLQQNSNNKPISNLLRNYLTRKNKRILSQNKKYPQISSLNGQNIQSRISDISNPSFQNKVISSSTRIPLQISKIKSSFQL